MKLSRFKGRESVGDKRGAVCDKDLTGAAAERRKLSLLQALVIFWTVVCLFTGCSLKADGKDAAAATTQNATVAGTLAADNASGAAGPAKNVSPGSAGQMPAQLAAGAGSFTMPEATGVNDAELKVFYYRPEGWNQDGPVFMVLHGANRNGNVYRDHMIKLAEQYHFLVVCPEFSAQKYPAALYNTCGVWDEKNKTLQPRDKWLFPVLGRVFAAAKERTGATREKFILFGHSAGAQFVHRYALLSDDTQAEQIISANAGWYTLPDEETAYPYGLKNLQVSKEDLARALARPVTILLGEKDIDPQHKLLRHTPQAEAQGAYRLERGKNFYAAAQAKAKELGVPFNWHLVTVPGVAHNGAGMEAAAVQLLFE